MSYMEAGMLHEQELPLADTLFRQSAIVDCPSDKFLIYVANPGCSACISKAINCYKAYLESQLETPFFFLLKSIDTALFDYYLQRFGLKSPPTEANIFVADLTDALYTVKAGRVVSIAQW